MDIELTTKRYRTRHDYIYFLTAARYFLNYKNAIKEFLTLGDDDEILNTIKSYSDYAGSMRIDELTKQEQDEVEKNLESFIEEGPLKDIGNSFVQLKIFGNTKYRPFSYVFGGLYKRLLRNKEV